MFVEQPFFLTESSSPPQCIIFSVALKIYYEYKKKMFDDTH